MNNLVLVSIAVIVVGLVSAYAVFPYFTESTIDEALPTGAISQSMMENKESMMMKDDDTMMEEEEKMMMKDDDTMMEEEEKMMMKDDDTMSMSFAGSFIGAGDGIHDAQGNAFTILLEDKSSVLRLENFKSTNGPDLYVYLSTDENASDFINLGELKANNGNQNYEIPNDADLSKYNKVLIWCKAFGVLFGSAELSVK